MVSAYPRTRVTTASSALIIRTEESYCASSDAPESVVKSLGSRGVHTAKVISNQCKKRSAMESVEV